MTYLDDLPDGISLQVFDGDELIFSSQGKWLQPLFDFENFLKSYDRKEKDFSSHDSAIGKAAAVLSIRLGIKKINAEILSCNAKNFIDDYNKNLPDEKKIVVNYKNLVPKLMCATENQLEHLDDIDEMYFLLRQRAKLVQGVSVKVENLSHEYIAKKNISFELNPGGHLMIVGKNGAGKTTLLKLICGLLKNQGGSILIDGKNPAHLEKFLLGYIPQAVDSIKYDLSVEEVISIGIGAGVKNKREIIKKSLERTSSLHLLKRNFSSLSGGEKQKINLSRCLAQNAKLLMLDEPTANLDAANKKMVVDILRSLTVSEIPTIIVVTHDSELVNLRGWEKLSLDKNGEMDG